MQYKFLEKNEEDLGASVIEKTGGVIKFTMDEVNANRRELLKFKREVEAKLEYEKARMTNVEQHHPFVLDMAEEDLFTAHLYQEAKSFVHVYSRKLKEVNDQIAKDDLEIEDILEQLPELKEVKKEDVGPSNINKVNVENSMNKVIELDNGKFGYKVLDEAGNTVRVGDEQFDTEAEAQAFVDGSGDGVKDEQKAPEGETTGEQTADGANADTAGEQKAPEGDGQENLG